MSKVVIVKGSDRERMVEKGLNALGVDPYKEKVVIKPNLIINRPYPVTTSPKTVECIVNHFKGKAREIIIAEGSGMCRGGTNKAFLDLGYFELAERSGIKLVDLNEDDYELRKNPEALKLKDFKFPLTLKNSFLIYKKPDLALIDGIESSSLELGGEVTRYDLMIFSEDPVAADAVGANILGLNPLSVPHIKLAQEKRLGMARLEEIEMEEIK